MKLLLDTHSFIWWDSDPARLSHTAQAALRDPFNQVLFSAATIWEIAIKRNLGKLALRANLTDILDDQRRNNLIEIPVTAVHAIAIEGLPPIHRDPFDRILVAQAIVESATLVTADSTLALYPVKTLW